MVCHISEMQKDLFTAKLRLLIQHGANVYALCNDGVTPVRLAEVQGAIDQFLDTLEEMGYDIEEVLDRSYEAEEECGIARAITEITSQNSAVVAFRQTQMRPI
jgi:phosphosulfolactate synthase (CoM biosynthesis protein A)